MEASPLTPTTPSGNHISGVLTLGFPVTMLCETNACCLSHTTQSVMMCYSFPSPLKHWNQKKNVWQMGLEQHKFTEWGLLYGSNIMAPPGPAW